MNRLSIAGRPLSLNSGAISPSSHSQSSWPASRTSSCCMLMIWSSRARNRSPSPVVSCFFGRIVPSDAATESLVRARREFEMQIARFRAFSPETLQSQNRSYAKNRISVNRLGFVRLIQYSLSHIHSPCPSSEILRQEASRLRESLAHQRRVTRRESAASLPPLREFAERPLWNIDEGRILPNDSLGS